METSTILLLVAIAIAACIALNYFFKVNIGISAIICAWIIGYFGLGMSVKNIVKGWPVNIAFQLMAITMFFSFPAQNGTLKKVADHFVYAFRKKTLFIPWVVFFAGFIIGGLGAPGATGNIIMGVIGYTIGAQIGVHPLITAFFACNGAAAGSELPWSAQGVIAYGVASEYWPEHAMGYTWTLWLAYFVVTVVMGLCIWLIFGGHKVKGNLEMEMPEPFTKEQRNTLIIIAAVVLTSLVFPILKNFWGSVKFFKTMSNFLDLQMLCICGVLVFSLLHYGNPKEAIVKGVPWNTIVMLGGMSMLMNIASSAGATDYIASALDGDVAPGAVIAILGIIAGCLSLFSSGMGVVFPMLAALVPGIEAATGISAGAMLAAICCGARMTAISPFSTGGALIVGANTDPKWERTLFNGCLCFAFVALAVVALFSVTGLFNLMVFD